MCPLCLSVCLSPTARLRVLRVPLLVLSAVVCKQRLLPFTPLLSLSVSPPSLPGSPPLRSSLSFLFLSSYPLLFDFSLFSLRWLVGFSLLLLSHHGASVITVENGHPWLVFSYYYPDLKCWGTKLSISLAPSPTTCRDRTHNCSSQCILHTTELHIKHNRTAYYTRQDCILHTTGLHITHDCSLDTT